MQERYRPGLRVLHWLMAAGFLFMWLCGYVMTSVAGEDTPLQEALFAAHISVGVTLLWLLFARVAMRCLAAAPPLPGALPRFDRAAARAGHVALYVLPLAAVAAGWAETDFGGHGVEWFGVAMPKLFPTVETEAEFGAETLAGAVHGLFAWTMALLASLHVAAVVKHRWIDGIDLLPRMTFGRKLRR